MNIESTITDIALLQLIGERLSQWRLSKNLTQAQLAEQAGLALRTVQRLELGAAATQLYGLHNAWGEGGADFSAIVHLLRGRSAT